MMSTAPAGTGNGWSELEGSPGSLRWFVAQTKPRQEPRVIRELRIRTNGIEPFLPRIEVTRHHAGRRWTGLEPLFPGYLFVRMQATWQEFAAVRWIPGVHRLLGDGDRPIEVPDPLIETIQARLAPLGFVRIGFTLEPGARVRILRGPFTGLEGILERPTSRQDRVRVLLQILGTVVPVEIDPLDLERAHQWNGEAPRRIGSRDGDSWLARDRTPRAIRVD